MMEDKIRVKMGKRAANAALIVNITLMLSKALTGFLANSTAITADALNNGTDIFATIAVFGGLRVAYKPPDENHHYGHAKAEPIVSKIVAIIIMATGATIGWDSIRHMLSGKAEAPGFLAIVISIFSIFIKYSLFKYTNRIGNAIDSESIVADSYNHRSDVLASTAVIAGVLGASMGFPILDPAAGFVVSLIILKTGVSIYMEAINALMDTAPSPQITASIKDVTLKTEGVIRINEIKVRKQGTKLHIDLKMCVDGNLSVVEGHKIASDVKRNIADNIHNVEDVMIHVNPCTNSNRAYIDCQNCHLADIKKAGKSS